MRHYRKLINGLLAAVTLLLIGCGGSSSPSPATASSSSAAASAKPSSAAPASSASASASSPTSSGSAAASANQNLGNELVFAAPGGSLQTGFQSCAFDAFQKQTGVRINYLAIQAAEALPRIAAQRGGQTIDVVYQTDSEQYRGVKQNLYTPFDPAKIPNLSLLEVQPPDKFGVPLVLGGLGIEYLTTAFQSRGFAPPTSWEDLWDPKYKGHVGIFSVSLSVGQQLLVYAARSNGGSEKNIDPGFAKMAQLKPSVLTVLTTSAQETQAFQQGNLWIAPDQGFRVIDFKRNGGPTEFVQPKEGLFSLHFYIDIVNGAPHQAAAQAFLNFMISPDVQSCIVTKVGQAPVIKGVQVPAETAKYTPTAATAGFVDFDWPVILDNLDAWSARSNKEIESK